MAKIGKKNIGDGFPCYITFEIGPTHEGLHSAKRLIKHASDAGADAVKFQIFNPDRLVADKKQMFSYGILKNRETGEIETVEEPLYDILVRRYLPEKDWLEIKSYCDKLDIAFFSTVGFDEDIRLLEKLKCHSIKIASADVNHFPLIKSAAKTGMCIQLDTGMATIEEIEEAVNIIRSENNENIIIHQCPSGYPAHLDGINLKIIQTLKKKFSYPVAFSDHTPGSEMDIAAVALGANMIEKTITENRMTRSVENSMSIEPLEMKNFVKKIKDVEIGLGTGKREISDEELKKRSSIRRSIFLVEPAKKGQQLSDCKIEFRRPGFGIRPDQFELVKDCSIVKNLQAGHMLNFSDIKKKIKSIAIIPARGGSKRLPRKNILPLDNIPLLTRVIKTIKDSLLFDEIIVSSEDEEIQNIAKQEGAKVHNRPAKLATDTASVEDTCLDVLAKNPADIFCCVYATAVLIKSDTLQKSSVKFLSNNNTNVLMGVSKYNYHPVQALGLSENGSAKVLFPKFKGLQSQKYPSTCVSNGTFYWARSDKFIKEKTFYSKKLKTFDVPEIETCDVDTFEDYEKLKKKFKP
jgi:N,N'-diacetyllegionaminate synthase